MTFTLRRGGEEVEPCCPAAHVADHRACSAGSRSTWATATPNAPPTFGSPVHNGNDPQLATLYFQFGRYLLLSCSRPGGQPATLQGLWNDHMNPPWGSKYTININTEMNYWPAESCNLAECVEPFTPWSWT